MSLRSLSFTIPGRLGGKGRHRSFMQKGVMVHKTPAKTASEEGLVAHLAALAKREQRCAQMRGPVCLHISIARRTPVSWSKKRAAAARWVTGKPDADNTTKLICDGINHSGVWVDDAQVAMLSLLRVYDDIGDERVVVTVTALEEAA